MYLKIESKDVDDTFNTPIVQQTSFWSHVKEHLGVNSRAFDFSIRNSDLYANVGGYSYTHADFLMFIQHLNNEDYIAYFPYGPEVEPSEENQGRFLEELSETLRYYLPKNCVSLRYDLNWQSHWCKKTDYDENGIWLGAPEVQYQEFQLNYGTENHNLRKSNTNILPINTIVVDLFPDEEIILLKMKPKTRYNIKLALKKGVEVHSAGIGGLDVWYELYKETAIRNGLHINDKVFFYSVFASKLESENDDVLVDLLVSYYDNRPLAAMFLLVSCQRATYLYGASSSERRDLMPTYALQWRAMQLAKSYGCIEYDMFGVAPNNDPSHPMYGLYKFKQGFGGTIYHQLGCWDYPFDEEKYNFVRAMEINALGYYMR